MTQAIPHLRLKASMLLLMLAVLICCAITYLMFARGVFESTQRLVLLADDSEGITVGMDVTYAGFPIGRVRRTELDNKGKVRILIDLAAKDAKWVRINSVFTMERSVVGSTSLKAHSGDLTAPPVKDGATFSVLSGDAGSEIPQLISTVHTLVDNLEHMTRNDSNLNSSLANVQTLTERMKGRYGVLGAALGDEAHAKKVVAAIDGVNQMLAKSESLIGHADGMVSHADQQIFGPQGVRADAQATVQQLNGLLADARTSLKKVDGVLKEAEGIAANARVATTDLGQLRAQVELSLRKVEALVNEVNRKWPLARDTELKLP